MYVIPGISFILIRNGAVYRFEGMRDQNKKHSKVRDTEGGLNS
jgi:hypothetical protein